MHVEGSIEQGDLRSELYLTYQQRIRQIERILQDLRKYDSVNDHPKVDVLFSKASTLRNRRIDFALYNLAMEAKRNANEAGIEQAKRNAMTEVKRHLVMVRRTGLQAWYQQLAGTLEHDSKPEPKRAAHH